MSTDIGVWLAGFITISIMSFVWKENPFFRIAEHLYVGVSAGHAVVMAIRNIQDSAVRPLIKGETIWIIPLVLGVLLYARYFKGIAWLVRLPVSLLVGIGTGVAVRGTIHADFTQQIAATIGAKTLDDIVILILVIASLSCFFFSIDLGKKGNWRYLPLLGRVAVMIAMGSAFGNTVMGRIALLIGRVQFILGDLAGLID